MPAAVVPAAAGRSLWAAAAWTGLATMLAGGIAGVVAVAVCWLPASGSAGNASSTIRAGLLTFLAGLHGGITVGGLSAAFLPLGLTIAIGALAYRAGCGLADVAEELGETDPGRLVGAAALQAGCFAVACGIAAAAASLGTSSVAVPGAVLAGFLLFAVTGGVAMARWTALADELAQRLPVWLAPAARIAAAVIGVYLAAGALLVAVSLAVHHSEVVTFSRAAGDGWSGLPVLLLGALAAPNAAVAGASYLAGPGFAVGSGTTVALNSTPHGTLPAFPVLGALPHGPAAWPAWVLAVATPLAAGAVAARIAGRDGDSARRWQVAGAGIGGSAVLGLLVAWQAGGGIGSGRLHVVGASPWQFGLVVAGGAGIVTAAVLGTQLALGRLDSRLDETAARNTGIRNTGSSHPGSNTDGVGDTAGGAALQALRGLRETVAEVAAEATQAARKDDDGDDRLAG